MSDRTERVARAIYDARNGPGALPWHRQIKSHKAPYLADARAAIEAMDGWSDDFSIAPHDVSLWVYATDDQGYAFGPASIWDSGNPHGPELVWNYDRKSRPINDGIERALMWHLVPQWPGEARLSVALVNRKE